VSKGVNGAKSYCSSCAEWGTILVKREHGRFVARCRGKLLTREELQMETGSFDAATAVRRHLTKLYGMKVIAWTMKRKNSQAVALVRLEGEE